MTYQASKQEDRFHCWPHMVGLAKARPNRRLFCYCWHRVVRTLVELDQSEHKVRQHSKVVKVEYLFIMAEEMRIGMYLITYVCIFMLLKAFILLHITICYYKIFFQYFMALMLIDHLISSFCLWTTRLCSLLTATNRQRSIMHTLPDSSLVLVKSFITSKKFKY